MNTARTRSKGFGLIEILVTLGILTVGILGVATLHGVITRQSGDNKARAEAISIAQSRIEEMRNYTSQADDQATFDALYAVTSGFANSATIDGVNAVFTRTESISAGTSTRNIAVQVGWTAPEGDSESVTLTSQLAYMSPRSAGDTALESAPELVDAPTGRARLGEGELPEDAATVANDDGTALYMDGGEDLMLVSDDQIVLTLTQACQTEDGTCIDFVKIKGTIWIDTDTQNNLDPGDVFVVASDAAFCARYYLEDDGDVVRVTSTTTTVRTTPSGDYDYFHYTCYIGGGWHGNVGIILAGGTSQSDKFCVGDPVSDNAWEQPVIASRRVYRGMLYKHDAGSDSGREEMDDGQGGTLVKYYSQGIGDSIEFPDPDTEDHGHDYVIASLQAQATEGSNCISQGLMVRPDTDADGDGEEGDLFAGNPVDFICLNAGFLDNFDEDVYGHDQTCPYDPSDPPSTRHIMSGTISVLATQNAGNDTLMNSINAYTSDGPGNCLVAPYSHNGTHYVVSYQCDVYDWGNGWNGYLQSIYDASAISCSPSKINKTGITADSSSGNNFSNCSLGSYAVFTGTVTAAGTRGLSSVTISGGGSCTVPTGGKSYECVSHNISPGTYTGTLTFTTTGSRTCSVTKTGFAAGYHTQNVNVANNNNCTLP
jgi:Tfp pilus assembly protein PilV